MPIIGLLRKTKRGFANNNEHSMTGFSDVNSTLAVLKPDALRRNLQGILIAKIQAAGFKIRAMEQRMLYQSEVEALYQEHRGKHFYLGLVNEMLSYSVVLMKLDAPITTLHTDTPTRFRDVVKDIRAMFTSYNATSAQNVIHGSDSVESAERELSIFFP